MARIQDYILVAVIGAMLWILPLPHPSSEQFQLYAIEAVVAVGVLILLLRDRDWFFE